MKKSQRFSYSASFIILLLDFVSQSLTNLNLICCRENGSSLHRGEPQASCWLYYDEDDWIVVDKKFDTLNKV